MKNKLLLIPVLAVLLTGCATPMKEAVKLEGKEHYQVTVLGDIHYDTKEYHTTKARTPKLEEKRAKNINQWQGNSQAILSAAAKASSDTAPFVIQLGDIINGDCQTVELQGIAMKTAFAVVKKYFNGKKLFSVCGNHEYWGPKGSNE
ncbi:MAG: metallophosphoesterase, partial [Lentisphaeria bacterium]|nr:metallophosphoesterase [Lentisphaeria bacterium]